MSEHAELIQRLRNVRRLDPGGTELLREPWAMEAAKALSSSQAEIERLREALKPFARAYHMLDQADVSRFERYSFSKDELRHAALSGQPGESKVQNMHIAPQGESA